MSEIIGFCIIVLVLSFSAFGFINACDLAGDKTMVSEKWCVEQGYAEFVPDLTNGTVKFEWREVK